MAAHPTSVLVVDDEPSVRRVVRRAFEREGFTTIEAGDGAGALAAARRTHVHVAVLDLRLPDMSGLDVLTELRTAPDTADLPVIMITALNDARGAVEALAAGADDHLAKPFDFEVLQARIERTLDRAGRIAELKRTVASLDARIAARAIELGETRSELAVTRARIASLSGTSAA